MERDHIRVFQSMLDEADKYEVPEAYAGEYAAYLQALVDSAVFTDDTVTSELATQSENDIAAIELGVSAEKDSILFYYEMREIVPGFRGRFVHTENMTFVYWDIKAGSILPDHSHPHEQVVTVIEGELEFNAKRVR